MAFLAGLAAPAIGGLIGDITGAGARDKAAQDQAAAIAALKGIQVPVFDPAKFEQQKVQGSLDPRMQDVVQQGDNAMANISTDPRLMSAQMSALTSLQQLGNTGLSAADKQALQNINMQAAGNANAAQGSIMANMAARGQLGGGSELAQRLAAAQNATNMGNQQGMSLASQAQQKALQAIAGAGSLGGQIQNQQFNQQASIQAAQNAINQFNAANKQNVLGQNTFASNQAQAQNLANQQAVANANTGITNQNQMYNKGLQQQQFQNANTQANEIAQQYGKDSNYQQQQAKDTAGMWGKVGQGVGQGITALGNMGGSSGSNGPDISHGYDKMSPADKAEWDKNMAGG